MFVDCIDNLCCVHFSLSGLLHNLNNVHCREQMPEDLVGTAWHTSVTGPQQIGLVPATMTKLHTSNLSAKHKRSSYIR